jgi:1-acyl-sn-glycerol-3-phosphate acyltransferase
MARTNVPVARAARGVVSRALLPFFRRVARRRVQRGLDGLLVLGLSDARAAVRSGPVIFAPNHVSWWDGLVLFLLDTALDTRSHVLVDRASLMRVPFFLWAGALPIDRSSGIRARRDLEHAGASITRPGDALWIFPQGRERPSHLRPLGLERGVELLRNARPDVPVIPVGIQYVFRGSARPTACVSFGAPVPAGLPALERGIVAEIDRLDAIDSAEVLLAPRRREDDLATRLLAWAFRRAARRRLEDSAHG